MKKLFMISIVFFLFSCEQEGELTKDELFANTISDAAVLKHSGIFDPTSGINVSGGFKIYLENNRYKLKLDAFTISDGPDLKIYLSKADTPTDFVTLGNLTSSTIYSIPQGVTINDYSHVLIHCQQYNHLFAVAAIIQN